MKPRLWLMSLSCLLAAAASCAADDASWSTPERFAVLTAAEKAVGAKPAVAPALASDEDRIAAVCNSSERLLIIDNFVAADLPAYLDVDGDGKPDVATGDAIAAIYRSTGRNVGELNLLGEGSIENIANLMTAVADEVERGEIHISAVMLSQSIEVPLESIGRDLHLTLKPEQFRSRRQEINEGLIRLMDENDSPDYGRLSQAVARLAARGLPLIVSAGNGGPGKVNLLAFLPGAIPVGSILLDGAKSPTSGDNSLVEIWRPGQVVLRRTKDGNVDVNGDGVGDFAGAKMTGEPTIASRFSGQPVSKAVIDAPTGGDFDILSRETPGGIARLLEEMPDQLYRTQDLIHFFHREGDPYARLITKQAPYYDKTMTLPFKADAKGRIVFDPAGDGSPDQVGLLSGAAFAAASVCRTR